MNLYKKIKQYFRKISDYLTGSSKENKNTEYKKPEYSTIFGPFYELMGFFKNYFNPKEDLSEKSKKKALDTSYLNSPEWNKFEGKLTDKGICFRKKNLEDYAQKA